MNAARGNFFWLLILAGLLPFVIVSFFNGMASDDYLFYHLYQTKGFFQVQEDLYHSWAGRYTSAFIIGCFVRLDIPGRHPWFPPLLYFAATLWAFCYLLTALRSLIDPDLLSITRMRVLQGGALLFFVTLYVQADIATGFYWFSSMVVYQTAFILFVCFAAILIRRLAGPAAFAPGDLLLLLPVLLIMGCNEMIAAFLPLFLGALVLACRYYSRPVPAWLWLCISAAMATGIWIVLTSGVLYVRRPLLNAGTGYLQVLPIIGFQAIAVLYYICKEPLFWVAAVLLFGLGVRCSPPGNSKGLALFRTKSIFLPGLMAVLALLVLPLTAFLLASRGSIPPRTLNNLGDAAASCLLAICFLTGIYKGDRPYFNLIPTLSPQFGFGVLLIVMLSSTNYLAAWKTVFSGYFYHAVLTDRDRQLRVASLNHQHNVVVLAYDVALREKINQVFPNGVFKTVRNLLEEKPAMLFYFDGAGEGDRGYAHFYGLDSIILRQK